MNSLAVCPTHSATISSAPQGAAVNRISSGNANARFRSVVLPYLDDAYTLARWLTGSRADSQDVVQDACLRALRGIGNFSHGNARAWVLTIVRHTAYSWLHKNRPAAVVLVEDFEAVERTHCIALDAETPETVLIAQGRLPRDRRGNGGLDRHRHVAARPAARPPCLDHEDGRRSTKLKPAGWPLLTSTSLSDRSRE